MADQRVAIADPLDGQSVCMDCGAKCSARWQYRFNGAALRLPPVPFCGFPCARRFPRKQGITGKFGVRREQTVIGRRYPLRMMTACEDCATLGPQAESRRCVDCALAVCSACQVLHRTEGHRLR